MRTVYYVLLFCLVTSSSLTGQDFLESARNQDAAILFSASYGPQMTAGDLVDRFGEVWSIEAALDYTFDKSPWQVGLFGQLIFGSRVKEDVIAGLRTAEGFIVGNQRIPADVQLGARGYLMGLRVARTFSFGGKNPRAGLKIGLGGAWLIHRIRLQNDPTQTVNQIIDEYRAGYDRLTEGPAAYQFIGYQILGVNRRINLYGGLELIEAFTSSKRDVDFATGGPLEENRLDILAGVRVGIIIPFYQGEGREIFYR
ncbi:MAG: hypothetical protein AAFU67_18495 [Bacteroidota bacterium]